MDSYLEKIKEFEELRVSVASITENSIKGRISILRRGSMESFDLIFTYSEKLNIGENIAGLILTMPVINFTYFAGRLVLDFPVSPADVRMIEEFVRINAKEVFVNKICRRRFEFFRKEYLPADEEITELNAQGDTKVIANRATSDTAAYATDARKSIVLSSGGKESLLTYGLMKESGSEVFPVFFNESGGHWRTAKTSYDYFSGNFENVKKVWSNIDRFYKFMIHRMRSLDQDEVSKLADTYPVQLFIFPVYVFSIIPLITKYGMENILMGNEFDDRGDMPLYHGIRHYFGVYDQSPDFGRTATEYFSEKGIPAALWSAVYPVSGLLVQNVLVHRYHDLFLLQRSCHSCHFEDGKIIPCGKCSKCLGVLSFILSSGGDPLEVGYSMESVMNLKQNIARTRMRLDSDEMNYILMQQKGSAEMMPESLEHVKGIHIPENEEKPLESVPRIFRKSISGILGSYSSGIFRLSGNEWKKVEGVEEFRNKHPELP